MILNGRFDDSFPMGSSQVPYFQRLGTPARDKRQVLYDVGHTRVPKTEVIRESLDWLDKYLGPVKR